MIRMKFKAFILMNVNLGCETEVLKALKKVQGFDETFYVLWGLRQNSKRERKHV
jgi:hypothetical protein